MSVPPSDPDIILRELAAGAGQKEGGQALLGGLDCLVQRNFFGAQIDSFETHLPAPKSFRALQDNGIAATPSADSFRALFIRAPAVLESGASVEVLAEYRCVRALSLCCLQVLELSNLCLGAAVAERLLLHLQITFPVFTVWKGARELQ